MTYTEKIDVKEKSIFPLTFNVKIVAEDEADLENMKNFLEETHKKKTSYNKWREDLLRIFKE